MIPFYVFLVTFVLFRAAGFLGWEYFAGWQHALQAAVACMLLIAASAHWGSKRADLVRMVPAAFPFRERIVTATGWLEIAGAVGMMIPAVSPAAAIGLAVLFVAMFPANVKAAKEKLTIGGRPVPGLAVRTILQLFFIAAVLLASPLLV